MEPCMKCFVLISVLVSISCFSRKFICVKWDLDKKKLNHNKELKTNKIKSKKVVLKAMHRQLLKLVLIRTGNERLKFGKIFHKFEEQEDKIKHYTCRGFSHCIANSYLLNRNCC